MAYNRKNMLIKAKKVQDVYLKHKHDGVTARSIYKNHIYPQFLISISSMYNYLGVNARKELRGYVLDESELNYVNVPNEPVNPEMMLAIRELVKLEIASGNKQLMMTLGTL